MKLTQSVLNKIIKEEITKMINEKDAQTNPAASKVRQQMLSMFGRIAGMVSATKTDKKFSEYANLEQEFYNFYQSGVDRDLALKDIKNPDVIPLAAAAAWYRKWSGKV